MCNENGVNYEENLEMSDTNMRWPMPSIVEKLKEKEK